MTTKDKLQAKIGESAKANALSEQKQFLAETMLNAPHAFASGYPDGTLYICNQAFCDLTGYAEAELREINWAVDLTPEEWRGFEAEKLAELHRTDEPQFYEKEYLLKDGTRIPVELTTSLIRDEAGNPAMYYAFVSDITKRKKAQEMAQKLYQVSRGLNVAATEDELLQVASRPGRDAGATEAILMYIDLDETGEPEWVNFVAVWRREGDPPLPAGTRLHLPDFPLARLWIDNPDKPLCIADVDTDEQVDENTRGTMKQSGNRALVLVPLTQAGRWVGLLNISWREPHEFTPQEIEIYNALPALVAPAVQNRRLTANLEQMVAERTAEVKRNQTLLETFLNNFPDLAFIKDKQGRIILHNRQLEIMFSAEEGSLLGKTVYDLVPKAVADAIWDTEKQVLKTGETVEIEEEVPLEDGLRFKKTIKFPLRNAPGEVYAVGGVTVDITEIKQKERELSILGAAVEQSADGIAIADMNGKIRFVNNAWAKMHGYTVEELADKPLSMFHTEEQLQKEVLPFNEQAVKNGQHEGEVGHVTKEGAVFPTLMTSTLLKDENGAPFGIVGIARDITEQKERQELISRLKSLIDNTNDFVSTSDLEGNILYTNPAGLALVGRAGQDPTTGHISGLLSAEWNQKVNEEYVPIIMEKGIWAGELEIQHVDGAAIPVSGVITLIKDDMGEPIGFGVIYRDITEQKRMQEERERLQQRTLEAQQQVIQELSSPIIPIMDRIIVMPLIGIIDTLRARDITRSLLTGISEYRAKVVILDITGVPVVDSGIAAHLDKTIQAARLKGARTIVTGISDAVAEAIVDLGIDWQEIDTMRDLQTGLIAALNSMGFELGKKK